MARFLMFFDSSLESTFETLEEAENYIFENRIDCVEILDKKENEFFAYMKHDWGYERKLITVQENMH